ncbi:hypothetical protein RUM44_000838 [Polyplax serrata]|uniref:Cilia- and flagella-associated protein 99 n=1 Tax=Polyplax serrata TaxID=468196 RepID=A0ABR1B8T7_POLSC
MFVPSVEAARITIELLNRYKHQETLRNALDLHGESLTPEYFLEKHFAENFYSREDEDMATEFFFRISKHRKFLEIIVNNFIKSKTSWATINPSETYMYIVFIYLLVVELNEFTRSKIEEILIAINDRKAMALVTFFRREDILTKLYKWGCEIWDVDYVTNLLQNAIETPMFKEVYDTVMDHLQKIKKSKTKALTVPVGPKCLSRPKKFTSVQSDEVTEQKSESVTRIPVSIKANKAPCTTYSKPPEIEKLEVEREKHREKAKSLLEEAQKKAFRCATLQKSEKFQQLTAKMEEESLAPTKRKIAHKKMPKPKNIPPPKKTAAVILREGARLLKLENEEIKRYEDVASGGFNVELLAEWEEEMREENFRKHIEDIERKHLEGLLTHEEVILAKQKSLKRKKEQTDEFKKEKEAWLKELEKWKQEEQIRLQEAFEKEKALEKGVKEAVEHVKEEKHKIALETMQESKALSKRRMKEKEEDLQRKVQMIKEIKALQQLGGIKRNLPNLSETANLGLLCEMSITELKERLFILRIEVQEELNKRKAEIKMKRECRKEIIDGYRDLIESHRQIAKQQRKSSEQGVSLEKAEKVKMEVTRSSSCLDELRRKLYEKRMERYKHEIS